MKILLCDADASARGVTRRLLQVASTCEVEECTSGPAAIELLHGGGFDALAIDVDLPVLTGLETVGILRDTPHLCGLPVLVITNDRTRESVVRSKELDVADYILKPVRLQRLQLALRNVASRPPVASIASRFAVQIDHRTRAMVVDGDEAYRDFLCGLLTPYCEVTSVTSGAFALSESATDPPTMVFIGRDLGPVGPAPLVRYLSRLGTSMFIKVAHEDELAPERATGLYAEVIPRTLVPAAVLKDLRRFLSRRNGPMARLLEYIPDVRSLISKTAATTFSMMLEQELDVVEPGEADLTGATAVVSIDVAEHVELRVELQCEASLLRAAAVQALGDESPDEHAQAGVLGEIANVLTGKVQAVTVERGTSCVCSLPLYRAGASDADDRWAGAERMVIEMAPRDKPNGMRIVIDVLERSVERLNSGKDEVEEPERMTA